MSPLGSEELKKQMNELVNSDVIKHSPATKPDVAWYVRSRRWPVAVQNFGYSLKCVAITVEG